MKKVFTIVFCLVSVRAFSQDIVSSNKKDNSVVVISDRLDIFYFKVKKELIGGIVEILNESRELLASQPIDQKKMLIDFIDAKPGIYLIQVKKDSVIKEFEYHIPELKSQIKVSKFPIAMTASK